MLTTAVSIFAAIALLLPGFVIVQLSLARSARSPFSDLELALRAIAYAVVIHLVFGFWTAWLVNRVGTAAELPDHVRAISVYVVGVLLVAPVGVGLGVNYLLARAEGDTGQPGLVAAALGAGEARDAFDFAYQRWRKQGVYVIVELVGHSATAPRLVGGVFGSKSAVGQTPSPHDVYLEALFVVEEGEQGVRTLTGRLDPPRGVYIAAEQIARIDFVRAEEPPAAGATIEP
jgi:hypothetical protein